MCYHVSLTSTAAALAARFNADPPEGTQVPTYHHVSGFAHPRLPVLTNDDPRQIQLFGWGLIPGWVKSEEQAAEMARRTLNARGETIFGKPSFRQAAARRRCLVLIDGFYEWMHRGGKKYPFFIQAGDGAPFAFGGLWEEWADRDTGERHRTCSIITTDANPLMAKIHNTKERMPLVLDRTAEQQWLRSDLERPDVEALIRPLGDDQLRAHTVSPLVSRQAREDTNVPEVWAPYTYEVCPLPLS
ncbi:MAG: SOS response-associated peptidase [Catalinimonas sp.]